MCGIGRYGLTIRSAAVLSLRVTPSATGSNSPSLNCTFLIQFATNGAEHNSQNLMVLSSISIMLLYRPWYLSDEGSSSSGKVAWSTMFRSVLGARNMA